MRLSNLTWPKAEEYFRAHDTVLIGIGSIECHGRHMPLGTDTLIPDFLLDKIEQKSDVLICPTIPYGATESLCDYPGTINLGTELLYQVLGRVCDSLFQHGARRFVILNGHGGNIKSIDRLEEIPDKRVYKELSDNMKTGVPEIILKQSDVKMPLRQLERVMLRAAGLADPQPTPKTDGATKELPLEDIVPALKTEAAKPENAEKADDFEALADLFARKDERREPKAEAAEAPAQKDEVPPRAAENAEKSEKSIDELLDELAATLKSPSGSGADKSAETGYNKKLEALLEELKAGAPSDDAPDDKK